MCGVPLMNTSATAHDPQQSPGGLPYKKDDRQQQLKPVATGTATRGRGSRHVYEQEPGAWWSHLLFGLGMLAFVTVPLLLPGITVNDLIRGYLGFLLTAYGIVCVWGIVRSLARPRVSTQQRKRHST